MTQTDQLILTHSSTMALLDCPTYYCLHYDHRLRPLEWRPALGVGRAVHRGCEVYTGDNAGQAEMAAAHLLGQECDDVAAMPRWLALVHVLWAGWAKHLGLPHGITAREQVLERDLGDGVVLTGIVDAMTYFDTVHDYKTTSSTIREAAAVQRHGIQIPTYQFLAGSTKPATVDIIKKPVLRARKGETWPQWVDRALAQQDADPLRFFARVEVPWSESSQAEMRMHYRHCADLVRHFASTGWPRKWGAGCKNPWGWCEYRPYCWYDDHDNFYKSDTAHDELGR